MLKTKTETCCKNDRLHVSGKSNHLAKNLPPSLPLQPAGQKKEVHAIWQKELHTHHCVHAAIG